MSTPQRDSSAIKEIKAWLTPILGMILWIVVWNDVRDVKSDVKKLMKYEIYLEQLPNKAVSLNYPDREELLFKPEEEFDVKRKLGIS